MKRSIVFIAGWQAAMAQAISGKVVDQQGKALPYVTCVLRSVTDSAYLAGTVTQADGTFSLSKPEAECVLHLSMMGHVESRQHDVGRGGGEGRDPAADHDG